MEVEIIGKDVTFPIVCALSLLANSTFSRWNKRNHAISIARPFHDGLLS